MSSPPEPRARKVEFVSDAFVVCLEDGRSLTVPREWFPRLRDATPSQRANYELIGPEVRGQVVRPDKASAIQWETDPPGQEPEAP
jgi:hypothetical protein